MCAIKNQKILIFGGSFNPPHFGHLHILKRANDYIKADKIIICVDKIPPWKKQQDLAPYKYRVQMVDNLMLDEITYSIYDNINNHTYTCDIITDISKQYPEADLYFLVGQDQYELITTWNNYDVINDLSTIVCYRRGDKPISRIDDKHIILTDHRFDCDSTSNRIKPSSHDIGDDNVAFIKKHHLYLQDKVKPYMSERRYMHTLRVLETIVQIAIGNKFSDEDILRCQIAALLHDIAKQYSEEQLKTILTDEEIKQFPTVHCAHGLAGKRLARADFDIHDSIILDAIENHVIFKDINTKNKVAKALFCADKLEPARTEQDISDRKQHLDNCIKDLDKEFKVVYQLNKEKY